MNTAEEIARPCTPAEAFAYCERLARGHYENFPVGSKLIPKELRRHFYSIYAYSRTADDIADEGSLSVDERIAMLDDWERQLEEAYQGRAGHPIFVALAETVRERQIPIEPLRDLLKAFRMDSRNEGFQTLSDLLYYCYHSANPVGRLVLHLFGLCDDERKFLSDKICTALQLANFWQDISRDVPRGRINLPRESIEYFGYSQEELHAGVFNESFRELMAYHVDHAMNLFQHGWPLLGKIPVKRLQSELTLVLLGGARILHKIRALDYNVLETRPSLGFRDKLWILGKMAAGA
jgi:squalene synthase HpnC